MQLLLSFERNLSSETEQRPSVWLTVPSEQQRETLDVLARLLAKAAATLTTQETETRKEGDE